MDYFDLYSHVLIITFIQLLLIIITISELGIHQNDTKIAFLNGDLDVEVYMQKLEGFVVKEKEKKVYKFVKFLYGLKQAPKQWYKKFDKAMLLNAFKINEVDKYIYIKKIVRQDYVIICL